MNIDQYSCMVTVSNDWQIILDVKNKFRNGWKLIGEEIADKEKVTLIFQRIYKVPENINYTYEYRELEEYA